MISASLADGKYLYFNIGVKKKYDFICVLAFISVLKTSQAYMRGKFLLVYIKIYSLNHVIIIKLRFSSLGQLMTTPEAF